MARPREFDQRKTLDAATKMFIEHGFEGTSAAMLVEAMKIGRQSIYDTFGDKWELYLSALREYATTEIQAHLTALRSEASAIHGINAAVRRVVREAHRGCLGVSSVCEFGNREPDINAIHENAGRIFRTALAERIREAQRDGELSRDLKPDSVVDYLSASFAGIRIAARAGARDDQLQSLADLALRALR
jgi:TetR/AcrR family transcriptional repressor of nem operon